MAGYGDNAGLDAYVAANGYVWACDGGRYPKNRWTSARFFGY
jgi:hypothetical protein